MEAVNAKSCYKGNEVAILDLKAGIGIQQSAIQSMSYISS